MHRGGRGSGRQPSNKMTTTNSPNRFHLRGSGGFGREPLVICPHRLGGSRIDFVARRGTWWHLPSKTPREIVIFFIFLHLSWEVLTFLLPRPPGDSWVPWVPLGASWVPPGCLPDDENQWKSMKFHENQSNSMKINEIQWNSMKINEIQWKSMKIHEI